jgi:integrase
MQDSEKPNKPITTKRRSRNPNGNPKPYRDGNRWKAPGYLTDGTGKTHKVIGTGSTQAAALKKLATNLAQRQSELSLAQLPKDLVSVEKYCLHWLQDKANTSRLAYKTKTGYESALKKWINPEIGHIKLNALTRQHIQKLFSQVATAGLSRSTQIQIRSVLQPALQDAEDNGFISKSPFKGIKMLPKTSRYPEFYDLHEIKKILDEAKLAGDLARWHLALVYGLRQGEVLGLKWESVELDNASTQLTISSQIQRQTGKGIVDTKLKTGKSQRTLPITNETAALLRELKNANELARTINGNTWNSNAYVFTSSKGTPRDPANDRKTWDRILKRAGVKLLPLHKARSSAGTNAGNLNVASKMLGHSGIGVTADYYANVPKEIIHSVVMEVQRQLNSI